MKKLFKTDNGEYFIQFVKRYNIDGSFDVHYFLYRSCWIFGFEFNNLISAHLTMSEAEEAKRHRETISKSLTSIYSDMKTRLYIFGSIIFALFAICWLISSLYVLQPNRINAVAIALGWFIFSLTSYALYDEYKKLKRQRPQKF